MKNDATSPFANILDGLNEAKQKFHKPRAGVRIQPKSLPALIEAGGQIFNAHILDISQTVLRVDHKFPISLHQNCVVILKTNPAIQLICSPIIDKNEFDDGLWCRLKIKSNFKFEHFSRFLAAAK